MTDDLKAYVGARIFDQGSLIEDHALLVAKNRFVGVVSKDNIPGNATHVTFEGGVITPGFVDLQVNGGGGVMFNDEQSVEALHIIARAHASLGTTSFLPTLITATPTQTKAAIAAVKAAIAAPISGVIGLHLEGPHLSQKRKGAHNADLVRPMTDEDLMVLLQAANELPTLKVTIAPESVTLEQVQKLAGAGVIVSLGHSDIDFETACAYAQAGASCVTHLFNAMSQLTSREPGLVGAALSQGAFSAGLIADGIHVHPETIRAALKAKTAPGKIFLVSDAMAVAGVQQTEFTLDGRLIKRCGGKLTLENGTLAGADLELASAVKLLLDNRFTTLPEALQMVTSGPANVIRRSDSIGTLGQGLAAKFLLLSDDCRLLRTA